MCHSIGYPPISIIGLGLKWLSSLILVPKPPAKITTFIIYPHSISSIILVLIITHFWYIHLRKKLKKSKNCLFLSNSYSLLVSDPVLFRSCLFNFLGCILRLRLIKDYGISSLCSVFLLRQARYYNSFRIRYI